MNLLIVIMLLAVFAGLIAFLIYSLISYRKRNIIKFLIFVCMVVGCEVVIAQSENINETNLDPDFGMEPEPTFETSNEGPGPIILPELNKAGNLLTIGISKTVGYYNSGFNETALEEAWASILLDMNNNSTSRNLTLIA